MTDFGRALCSDPHVSTQREWLVTNGLGGYAMGTISGVRARCYHGLLVAALDPPLGRTVLVAGTDAAVTVDDTAYPLAAHQWADGTTDPRGFVHLDRFRLDRGMPVWTYTLCDALIEKRLWMAHGANTTYVRYTLVRGRSPVQLRVKTLVNHRDHHATTQAGGWTMDVSPVDDGVQVQAFDGAAPLFLKCTAADATPAHDWYHDFYLATEAYRGLDAQEDHLHAATFRAELTPGASVTLVLSTEADAPLDGAAALQQTYARDEQLLQQADLGDGPAYIQQLIRAADQFVVARSTDDVPDGRSIIAGYPWFGDWGRDTMMALPGLTLVTGRPAVAATILRTYGQYVDRGMIPNRFPDQSETPEYNTVDATLWYVEAIRAYVDATGDHDLLRDLFPVLKDIIDWHERGTRYGIQVDPEDGLLRAGERGVQLTWMDAKVGDWVVTPRMGKPVEVNALWYNALRSLEAFADVLDEPAGPFTERAAQVEAQFNRFWDADRGYCVDVIDGPDGDDPALRPNQLLAVSLPHSPLDAEQQRAVVEACGAALLTPHGLRSLAPDNPNYRGIYGGSPHDRDAAYHQGTVWSWLLGPFVQAHLRVYDDPATAQSFLTPLLRHLGGGGCGSTISEIFDGDAPFAARGAPAQAWGVAQLLEAWQLLRLSRTPTAADA
ncbi:MAG: glycogen debranching protein [Bacteroidetes bacterium]|nr:glycogen debranching protein [Bacteroidota bacterium]